MLAMPRMLARRHADQGDPVGLQVQRRLKPTDVDALVTMYESGSSVPVVAEAFGLNRETVMLHLERRGVRRRANLRKLTDEDVRIAAGLYGEGASMLSLVSRFSVDATTLRRELDRAGVELRRPGRPRSR
jgi:hypothetical protein